MLSQKKLTIYDALEIPMTFLRTLLALAVLVVSAYGQTEPRGNIKATTTTGMRVWLEPKGTWKRVVDARDAPHWRELGEIRVATLLSRNTHREVVVAQWK